MWYYTGTPEGVALMAESNVKSGLITNLVYVFCFMLIFLMYLFANRIGCGFGIKYGKYVDDIKDKVTIKAKV